MKKYLLIDVNNVIHKSPRLKSLFSKDKKHAILSFIEKVKTQFGRNFRIEFYLDGHGETTANNIFYSMSRTADELIRKRIEDSNNHRNLTVVSSDSYITGLAKACGCEVKSSEEFLKLTEENVFKDKNINHVLESESEKPKSVSRKDLDYYKNLFS
ncbi:MAG: NYN domain-containing protein [Bacteroidetes bacterium]|nr:NYN domain-containing protein [Bacteroidota bacterium]